MGVIMQQYSGFGRRLKLIAISILVVASCYGCSNGNGDALYYVALGDSLSLGVQPDASGANQETDQGYVNLIYASLLPQFPNLQLIQLGCPSETTASMISGGVCADYETGSQLGDATNFLVENQAQILLVTLDIGANDVVTSECLTVPDPAEQQACFQAQFRGVGENLSLIANALFAAADGQYPTIGMNYYNTFLAAWLTGPQGQALAMATAALQSAFNTQVLGGVYGLVGFPVADVASAFNSDDFTTLVPFPLPPPNDMVPLNVATLCANTYMCVPPPIGPNIHANAMGYQLIANTFLDIINGLPLNQ